MAKAYTLCNYCDQPRQKATKNLPTLELDVTVSYVGHAFPNLSCDHFKQL